MFIKNLQKIINNGYKFTFLLPFYICKIMNVMPVQYNGKSYHDKNYFKPSFVGAIGSFIALLLATFYIYQAFKIINSCSMNGNCPESYIGITDACYTFALIFTILFFKPFDLCAFLNSVYDNFLYTNENLKFNNLKFNNLKCFLKIISIFLFIFAELLRKFIAEPPYEGFDNLIVWLFMEYNKNIVYSIDAFLISFLCILESNLQSINYKLKLTLKSKNPQNHIERFSQLLWKFTTTVKMFNTHIGSLFLIVSVFKQVQIIGMIYFTLLADIEDSGNNLFQALDLILPTINFIWISFNCSTLTREAKRCMFIYQDLHTKIYDVNVRKEIEFYQDLNYHRRVFISASNFFVMRLGLFIKVVSVTMTYIVAVVQLEPGSDTDENEVNTSLPVLLK